jgi:hypothetical protein
MPQFCFTIIDGSALPFNEHMELPDIQAARAMALRTSGEIISHLDVGTWDDANEWAMHMTDEASRMVMVIKFSATTSVAN